MNIFVILTLIASLFYCNCNCTWTQKKKNVKWCSLSHWRLSPSTFCGSVDFFRRHGQLLRKLTINVQMIIIVFIVSFCRLFLSLFKIEWKPIFLTLSVPSGILLLLPTERQVNASFRVGKTRRATGTVRMSWKNRGLRVKAKMILWEVIVVLLVLNYAEMWCLREVERRKLGVFELGTLRSLHGLTLWNRDRNEEGGGAGRWRGSYLVEWISVY